MMEYEEPDTRVERWSQMASPSNDGYCEKYTDAEGCQNPLANLFAGEADMNVKEMAQGGGSHDRHDKETD